MNSVKANDEKRKCYRKRMVEQAYEHGMINIQKTVSEEDAER